MTPFAIAALVLAAAQDPAAGPHAPPPSFAETTVALPPLPEPETPPAAKSETEPARAAARILPAGPEPAPSRKLEDRPEAGPGLGGFILWSGVVMALMAGTFVLMRRLARGSRFLAGGGAINVLARKPLGQKQEVFLVEVGPKVFLVGSARDRLSTLGEFSNPDDVASLRASLAGGRGDSAGADFRASLRAGLRREEEGTDGRAPAAPAPSESAAYASIAEEVAGIRSMVRAWRV
jgi:flagellar biogenesis protein FliO